MRSGRPRSGRSWTRSCSTWSSRSDALPDVRRPLPGRGAVPPLPDGRGTGVADRARRGRPAESGAPGAQGTAAARSCARVTPTAHATCTAAPESVAVRAVVALGERRLSAGATALVRARGAAERVTPHRRGDGRSRRCGGIVRRMTMRRLRRQVHGFSVRPAWLDPAALLKTRPSRFSAEGTSICFEI